MLERIVLKLPGHTTQQQTRDQEAVESTTNITGTSHQSGWWQYKGTESLTTKNHI